MKAIKLSLCLAVLSLGAMAQNNNYPTAGNPTIYEYSPTIFLQRNNSEGGYTQGIQTRLFDGTNNWFFGNLHDGQWMVAKGDYNNPKLVVSSNGNVGIGTLTPNSALEIFKGSANEPALTLNSSSSGWGSGIVFKNTSAKTFGIYSGGDSKLHFSDNNAGLDRMVIADNGNVGIGTTAPLTKLDVNGTTIISNSNGTNYNENLRLPSASSGFASIALGAIAGDSGTGFGQWSLIKFPETMSSRFSIRHNNDDYFNILTNGNLGIGTATPNEKLAVNGKIRAKEIKVETANWPDYVFEEGYKVGTLQELEGYIKTNKRLPEMPSAKEVEANGIALGEIVKLQQKKIEELTLHLIEKDKQLQNSNKRLENLETKQKELEALIQKITMKN